MEPRVIWEDQHGTNSGMRVGVRGAEFSSGGKPHSAVSVTFAVPPDFASVGDYVTATLMLDPEEAVELAEWLRRAAAAAEAVGPGLYSEAHEGQT